MGEPSNSAERSLMRRWIVAGLAAAVVLGLAAVAWSYRAVIATPAMTGVIVAPGSVSLGVADQSSPAGVLMVGRVKVPGPSWIVVSTLGTPERAAGIVGYAAVPAGESRDVTVTLTGQGIGTQKLTVTLHADRGIAGRFEFDPGNYDASPDKPYFAAGTAVSRTVVKDTAVLTIAQAAGALVTSEIGLASGQAVLQVADRLTVIDSLVVDRVVVPGPSWVVVYLVDDAGRPSGIAGATHVDAGESTSVVIDISPDVVVTDKLLVAVQKDAGTVGRLEFSVAGFTASPDKPYSVAGSELSSAVLLRGYGMDFNNTAGSGSGM
jgi:hypothetical protein